MTQFERRLRERIDSKYLREPAADNPLWRLVNDRLPLDECRAFYVGLRDSLAVFNRVLLGRLLEESPTERARSQLLPVIAVEFGPPVEAAHPAIFHRFLRSLGVPESEMRESADLLAESSACAVEVEWLRKMSWCELLARLLVGETQGPVVFPVILEALKRNYGLRSPDLLYFSIHASHDKKDTEILFDLLARSVKSQSDEQAVLRIVDETFDSGRYAVTGSKLEAKPRYRFADYSSRDARTKLAPREDLPEPADPADLGAAPAAASIPEPAKETDDGLEVGASLERKAGHPNAAPIRKVLHRMRSTLRARLSDESFQARLTEAAFVRDALERIRSVALEWEFVVGPRLLQMCPDLDARVLVWQVAHASYGSRRGEAPPMKLLAHVLSHVIRGEERGVKDDPARRARLTQSTLPELIARGLVADNLIALECLPVIRRALRSTSFGLAESELGYFHRAVRDASFGLEIGVDLLARYAAAGDIDDLVARAFQSALDASPYAALVERARHPHAWSNWDVTPTTT